MIKKRQFTKHKWYDLLITYTLKPIKSSGGVKRQSYNSFSYKNNQG